MRDSSRVRFCGALCVFGLMLLPPGIALARAVISEVMWMGSDLSASDEWLEIAGVEDGAGPTGLSGWTLTSLDSSGNEKELFRFQEGDQIAAGEYKIASHYGAEQSRLLTEPTFVTSSLSLLNEKLFIRLRDASGAIADEVDDGVGAPFAGKNSSVKASMERLDLSAPGNVKENWATATVSHGFDEGAPLLGTPGFPHEPSQNSSQSSELSSSSASSASSASEFFTSSQASSSSEFSETSSSAVSSPVRITEILPDAFGVDNAAFVEVGNLGEEPVDIAGFVLAYGSKTYVIPPATATGFLLRPRTFAAFRKTVTTFSLNHQGGTVTLSRSGTVLDTFFYSASHEGVSFGRVIDQPDAIQPFCVPTEGGPNTDAPWNPLAVIQSGEVRREEKVTINLQAQKPSGYEGDMDCLYDFGDGATSDDCNPGAHVYDRLGRFNLQVRMMNQCGKTMIQDFTIEVLATPNSSTVATIYGVPNSVQKMSSSSASSLACAAGEEREIFLNEFLPNPAGKESEGEWIELSNDGKTAAPLCGWALGTDSTKKQFPLDAYTIDAGYYLLLPRSFTALTLRNANDIVRLFAPMVDGTREIVQEVRYENAPEGESFARDADDEFDWTASPTPGLPNFMSASSSSAAEENKKSDQKDDYTEGMKQNSSSSKNSRSSSSNSSRAAKATASKKSTAKKTTAKKSTSAKKTRSSASPDTSDLDSLMADLGTESSGAFSLPSADLKGLVSLVATAVSGIGYGVWKWRRK